MVRAEAYAAGKFPFEVGGVFLDGGKTDEEYKKIIADCKKRSKYGLLIATDLEGYWNPFQKYPSKKFGEIKTGKEAYELGKKHALKLKSIGFNMDFSPVVEMRNKVWPGRSFVGSMKLVRRKIKSYIKGLEENGIMATAKHYPGGSMIQNPHFIKVRVSIDSDELENFFVSIKAGASAVMVGHAIVRGALNSSGKQATVSPKVIGYLRKRFDGLIITDDVNMLGLRFSYLFSKRRLYKDIVKAGNDMILESWGKPRIKKIIRGHNSLMEAVSSGEICESKIDASVRRILCAKGFKVN